MPNCRIARRGIGRIASALALLFALARAAPCAAQPGIPAGSGSEEGPIRIQSDAGIEWQQNQHVYIARGNAVAARGNNEVRADTLIAHYREKPNHEKSGGGKTGSPPGAAGESPIAGSTAPGSTAPGSTAAGSTVPGSTAAGSTNTGLAGGLSGEGGSTEIFRVEAIGNVVLKHEASTVTGERAVYDIDQGIAVVTGKNLKLTTATDVVTARDSLEWYEARQIAVARGDAVATRAPKTIKADILTAYMHKSAQTATKQPATKQPATKQPATKQPVGKQPPAKQPQAGGAPHAGSAAASSAPRSPTSPGTAPGTVPGGASGGASGAARIGMAGGGQEGESRISRVDAQGHVVITDALNTGRGDFGVYNGDTGIATLIGNVVIQRGANVIQGQRGVMDLNNNVARMMPGGDSGDGKARVQGLLVREQAKPGTPGSAAGAGGERKHP
jgi:lipopolysaccharide export system protein LptA